MEITNICPYCGKEMSDGAIPAVRDVIRWCRKKRETMAIIMKKACGMALSSAERMCSPQNISPLFTVRTAVQ